MLPRLLPMLAVPAIPFDSLEYGFEIKWDGIRVLAAVETVGWTLWGRQHADYTDRYPELEILRRLPAGTLVDGELVAVDAEGRHHLARLLRRHGRTSGWKIGLARRTCPVQYVLFDLLYHRGHCLLQEPLARRREVLAEACRRLEVTEVSFSEAVVGPGTALYAAALARGHEGVVAKHLGSAYRPCHPGSRSSSDP